MRYNLTLKIDEPAAFELLEPLMGKQAGKRSRSGITKSGHTTVVEMEASDATALRSQIEMIIQPLKVFEKMENLK